MSNVPVITLPEDRRAEQGLWLFLASLAVFFFSSIFLYAIYVLLRIGPSAGVLQPFHIPNSFVPTTFILLMISGVLHVGLIAVRREKQSVFRCCVVSAFGLSLLFIVLQWEALSWMLERQLSPSMQAKNLYGLTIVLVVLHALHVVGGLFGLFLLMVGFFTRGYDHERHLPVKGCVIYWHFLGIVWMLMLGSFFLAALVSRIT
jgi:cytochrome c oxidase subunit 3